MLHTAAVRSTCPVAAEGHSTSLAAAADHHSSRPVVVGHSIPAAHLAEGNNLGRVQVSRSHRYAEAVGKVQVRRSRALENRMCCLRGGHFVRCMDLRRSVLEEVVGGMEEACWCPVLDVVSCMSWHEADSNVGERRGGLTAGLLILAVLRDRDMWISFDYVQISVRALAKSVCPAGCKMYMQS